MNIIKFHRPTLSPLPGFARLSDLHDEIHRLFETPSIAWTPPLDVYEDNENLVVKAELPGVKREEIEVELQDGTLTISGERKTETKHEDAEVYHAERFVGKFERSVVLPTTVGTNKVKAAYADGVLTITLPKTEEAKLKKIDVSVN